MIKGMGILCKLGIHRPLKLRNTDFVDRVTGLCVRNGRCSCGINWLTDSWTGWWGFRVRRGRETSPKDQKINMAKRVLKLNKDEIS